MKNLSFLFLVSALLCSGCWSDPDYSYPVTSYKAILMERTELESSIKWVEAKAITNAGKIYSKDDYLFINELFEGVHVYNNADPSNPEPLGFIVIPGNVDISIKGDIIYADNAVDLIALRFENNTVEVLDRNVGVFPEVSPPDNLGIPYEASVSQRPENTIIVKWVQQ